MELICSKSIPRYLTAGKRYKVTKRHSKYNMLNVISDDNKEYTFSANQFVTLEQWKDNFKAMLFSRKFIVI